MYVILGGFLTVKKVGKWSLISHHEAPLSMKAILLKH